MIWIRIQVEPDSGLDPDPYYYVCGSKNEIPTSAPLLSNRGF